MVLELSESEVDCCVWQGTGLAREAEIVKEKKGEPDADRGFRASLFVHPVD